MVKVIINPWTIIYPSQISDEDSTEWISHLISFWTSCSYYIIIIYNKIDNQLKFFKFFLAKQSTDFDIKITKKEKKKKNSGRDIMSGIG